ncbi:hypothetical protein Taro_013274 [Colocasia esculenta]|uniref:Uncharacterized protein n=1 Tax=Colocasia esculenta TaxID=4460 RepID=A0A843UB44_COLES|nr:hypothetical protein [Colocasia esculenta]
MLLHHRQFQSLHEEVLAAGASPSLLPSPSPPSLSFSFSLSISQLISFRRTTSLPPPSVPRPSIPSIGHPILLSVSLPSQSPPPGVPGILLHLGPTPTSAFPLVSPIGPSLCEGPLLVLPSSAATLWVYSVGLIGRDTHLAVQLLFEEATKSLMLGKKVKLCDMEGQLVANAIIMSLDKSKMVMSKSLGEEYYEVELDET